MKRYRCQTLQPTPSGRVLRYLSAVLLFIVATAGSAWTWPLESQWIALTKDNGLLQDPIGDAQGSRNVVSDPTHATAYLFNDGAYLNFRMRLDDYPLTAQGGLKPYGWGFEIDVDQNADNYEWLIMADGIINPEGVRLERNTIKGDLGDPSDISEDILAQYPMFGNVVVSTADTMINGDQDYFLDFRIPFEVFKMETGLTDDSLIRFMVGSSSSANNLTENGSDLVGGSTLYEGMTDFVTAGGTPATELTGADGSVVFVEGVDGFGDLTLISAGQPLYIRVNDLDQISATNPGQTIRVTLTTPGGDEEVAILTHTGVSGKFTGSMNTTTTAGSPRDNVLQVAGGETVTVTYLDVLTAVSGTEVPRTDTLLVTATGTDLALSKEIDDPVPSEGELVTFILSIDNLGPNDATGVVVRDLLPAGLTWSGDDSGGNYDPVSGDWLIGPLSVGIRRSLAITASVDVGTSDSTLTNTATLLSLDQTDEIPTNDSASAALTVGGTDLEITKSVNNDAPAMGDLLIFTLEVKNYGPQTATNIMVSDILPAALTYSSDDGAGDFDPISGLWSVGDLATGSKAKLRIRATVNPGTAGMTVTNTAQITAVDQTDAIAANNTASTDIRIGYLDLAVSQTANPTAPLAAGPVTLTIVVANTNLTHNASTVVLRSLLPPTLTYVSDDSGGTYDPATGLWSVGTLNSGANATLTINATVNAGAAGQTIINTAALESLDQLDEFPGNDSASVSLKVDGTDLALSAAVSNNLPAISEQIRYTVTIVNNGPAIATNVAVTDFIPAGVTFVKKSAAPSQGSYSEATQTWAIGTLAIGASATLTFDVTVNTGTEGQSITNSAFITAKDQDDPDDTNNIASVAISVMGTDLAMTKTVSNSSPDTGIPVTYSLSVFNGGPRAATGVSAFDLLPAELEYLSHVVTPPQTYDPGTGVWQIDTMNSMATTTLDITVRVKPDADKLVITNTAQVTATGQGDPVLSNNIDSVDIFVNACDIALSKTVSNPVPNEQDTITYTVTASNIGGSTGTNIEVEDFQPVGVTFVTVTPNQGSYNNGIWQIGTLAPSASATLTITATVDRGTAGATILNEAVLHSLSQTDTNPGNNEASIAINPVFVPEPSISILKMAQPLSDPLNGAVNPKAIPGAEILYTLNVMNSGGGTTDSDSVTIIDPLPVDTDLFVNDFGGGSPVVFIDGTPSSGLNLAPANVLFSTDGVSYTTASSPDADGYDATVRYLKVVPTGPLNASDGFTYPSFTLRFKVRIR